MIRLLFLCLLCGASAAACGRKGPPLAPIVYLPRAVGDIAAKRVENEVVVQFTVPTLNTDGSSPADLRRVEVYAHTGPLPAATDFQKYGTLVASIDIADPEQLKESSASQPAADGNADAPVAGATQPANASAEVGRKMTEQGWLISVREPLTAKEREIGPMPPARAPAPAAPNAPVVETIETPGTENFELTPTRFYTAVGVSRSRGRRGPYAGPVRVPLVEPLMPPVEIAVAWTETTISLTWPRQPEDAPPPPTPAVPAPATPAGAPPAPATTTPSSPSSSGSPVPSPTAAAPPVAAAPAVAATKPPAPALPSVGLQETSGTHEVYADLETEDTRDIAPPAPPATPGAKPSPAAAAALAAAAKAAAAGPAPRYGYNVYDAPASAPASHIATAGKPGSGPASQVATPEPNALKTPSSPILPLNKTMLTVTTFADPRIEFDVERCYVIRRVELSGGVAIESGASAPVCVTPRDTFPPAAPRNVQAISGGAGVSLLWDANTEPDFGGYLVLRGEAPGDKLSPLTPSPIADTSFNDTTVRRGRTYVYEVIAVDKQTPANRSAPSNRVEETIR